MKPSDTCKTWWLFLNLLNQKEIESVSYVATVIAVTFVVLLVSAAPAMAQPASASVKTDGVDFSGAFGVGLTVIGAAWGIGKLATAALESMARQPEIAGSIQTAMIIAAALIEGFTFYALFICSGQNPWPPAG